MTEKPSAKDNDRTIDNTDEPKEPRFKFLRTLISKGLEESGVAGRIIATIGNYITKKM